MTDPSIKPYDTVATAGSNPPNSQPNVKPKVKQQLLLVKENAKAVEPEPVKRNATDFNYNSFKDNKKDEAMEKAQDAINEFRRLISVHNANNPTNPYVLDLDAAGFPDPQDYTENNCGNKNEAFKAWEKAVDDWKVSATELLIQVAQNNQQSMLDAMKQGFTALYTRFGLSEEHILYALNLVQGNQQDLKDLLDGVKNDLLANSDYNAADIKKLIETRFRQTKATIADQAAHLSGQIYNESTNIQDTVTRESGGIQGVVVQEGNETRKEVRTQSDETRAAIEGSTADTQKQMKEAEEINDLAESISNRVNNGSRLPDTVTQVENLRRSIVSSTKFDHNKKVELLNNLLNLISTDGNISNKDLSKITAEVNKID